jgi:indole-3-glycerol phosphate synthase
LIVRALGPTGTQRLSATAEDAGIEALFEVRDEQELEWALEAGAKLIGVNRRNLESLELDDGVPRALLPVIPSSCIAISESGITDPSGVIDAAAHGADAVLVGSSLSASSSPRATLQALLGVPRQKRRTK